ncbi:MAG: CAP domain-containing protein [Candidatus Gottesmanbacteria bacterium]
MRSFAFRFLLPHESNNFKPHSLHLSAIVFYIIIFLLLQTSLRILKLTRPDILGFATDINIEKVVNLTNNVRAEAGLTPLSLNNELSAAAAAKANDMFNKNYWAHFAPDGTTPWIFIQNAGYHYLYAGENLAKDFNDSPGVVSAWMASPTHKDNILKKEYQDIGLAVVNGRLGGEETTLVVQLFGTKQPSTIAVKPVVIPPVAATSQTSEIIASPTPTPLAESTPIPSPELVSNIKPMVLSNIKVQGVKRNPILNFFAISKDMATIVTLLLLGLLIIDGAFIWRKRIVRVSGHNVAHVIFLAGMLGALWVTSQGVVL